MGLRGRTKEKDTDSMEWRLGLDLDLGMVQYLGVLERHPQLSLATRGEDWASQGQQRRKPVIPIVT